jgi:hypothetical protein
MIGRIVPIALLVAVGMSIDARGSERVHNNAMPICAIIINEMSEGKISRQKGEEISLAIARAGNKYFGRVTCGDMWLYMALVHVESGFRNNVINYYNCRGMFQVHAPSWARKFGLRYADLLDLETNADCGVRVFKYYLDLYREVVPALSAYNSDHPRAALGYARAVLYTRIRIKKRYAQLYQAFKEADEYSIAGNDPNQVAANPVPAAAGNR